MTKHDILEYFKDINIAYNNALMFDALKDMLDELESEMLNYSQKSGSRPKKSTNCKQKTTN